MTDTSFNATSFTRAWTGVLALSRASTLPTVWMNVITAVVVSGSADPLNGGVLLLASMSAFYTSGMALNDVFDAAVDEHDQPYRPIPSGQITLTQALAFAVGLLAIGVAVLLATPFPTAVVPGLALGIAIVVYDRFHKSHPWTVVVMASCRLLVYLVCGWAMTGTLETLVVVAGTLQFAFTLAVTVVARREGQRQEPYEWPVVPYLIAGMCLVDGLFLAAVEGPLWLLPALGFALMTRAAQKWLPLGD